jgi:integrase
MRSPLYCLLTVHSVMALGPLLACVSGESADPRHHDERPLLIAPACAAGQRGGKVLMRPLSGQQLYRQLKGLFARTAEGLEGQGRRRDAQVLKRASTHWLRHTHGTHCVRRGVAIDVVQQSLGHASLSTTSVYVHAGLDRRIIESRRLMVER